MSGEPADATTSGDTIRAARSRDRAMVLQVALASGLFAAEELTEVDAVFGEYASAVAPQDRWLVDDVPGAGVVAVAYFAPERMTNGTWNLLMLAVHASWQGRGRGAGLVRRVEQDPMLHRARLLMVETSGVPEFAGQRRFYARLGYREEARVRDFYDAGDDKVIFMKSLSGQS